MHFTISRILFASLLFVLIPSSAFAYTCSLTYENIAVGDTLETVLQRCGKPTAETSKEIPITLSEPTEQWFYSRPGSNLENKVNGEFEVPDDRPLRAAVPDYPVVFTFNKKGKVTGVTLNSQEVGSTSMCEEGSFIKMGDDIAKVRSICGEPDIANRGTKRTYEGIGKQVTWTYDRGAAQTPLVLIFENNVLTSMSEP